MLPPEGLLNGENKDVMIMAKEILNSVRHKIEEGELNERIRTASNTLKTLSDLVTKMDIKVDRLDMDMYNRQIADIGDAARAMRETTTRAGNEVTTLARQSQTSVKQVEETAVRLSELSVQLNAIATKLNDGEGSMGELLHNKQYVQNLNSTVTELKLLVEDIKKNPGRYVSVSVF